MEWIKTFGEVLFLPINQLLKPEVYQTNPHGITEMRLQAFQLLCKPFLGYLTLLSEWEGMVNLWTHILGTMNRLMNSGQSSMLVEAMPESLKNVLLRHGRLPRPTATHSRQRIAHRAAKQLWSEIWTRNEKFLPGVMAGAFPQRQQGARARAGAERRSGQAICVGGH